MQLIISEDDNQRDGIVIVKDGSGKEIAAFLPVDGKIEIVLSKKDCNALLSGLTK